MSQDKTVEGELHQRDFVFIPVVLNPQICDELISYKVRSLNKLIITLQWNT